MIELMIALLLSTLLTLGILTMYLDSTETSRVSRSLARVQESGRIALDLIARDLRMVGYQGCSYPMQDFIPAFVGSNLDSNFYDSGLQGARAGANGWSDTADNFAIPALEASAVTGSDVLQIRRTAGPSFALDQDMANESSVIDTESDRAVAEYLMGQNALITNCAGADIFTVGDPDGLNDDQINHQALSQSYPEGSRIYHFNTTSYWTGDTGRTDQNGNAIFALYQNGLEVVSGVERLQVLYGVRDDDNVQFQDAENMGNDDWNSVDMVQLGLLVSDEQSVLELADAKDYELPGMTVQPVGTGGADAVYPADDRLRAAFTMTIKVRNRIDVE
ncbi:PilW family protein [Marinobacter oulmenensis]|uniref:Type IV pilus assembly protein PilW n=1 Tax=Marinobacter oulmenensis TaxID=643747 RepID=A0A840U8X5_9GAMM|nr:PilW family protein [Marinobacter oulmenensis]MBB5322164.1 type IV pilus assembly protein PilW [Marinobacter oulmenensis]